MVRWTLHFTEALCSALMFGNSATAFLHPSPPLAQARPTSKSDAAKISSTFYRQRQPAAPYMSSAQEAHQDRPGGDSSNTKAIEPQELVLREFCMPLQKSPGAYFSRVQLECLVEGGDTGKVVRWHVSDADEERGEAQVEVSLLLLILLLLLCGLALLRA